MSTPKKSVVTPLNPAGSASAKASGALPPALVAALFAEAGVAIRQGRPETISATLGPAAARFRAVAQKLAFEREPGLFPPIATEMPKKRRARR